MTGGSSKEVNYTIRPRKQTERRIIVDILHFLENKMNIPIRDMRYSGMGAVYFYDFVMLHKQLNIKKMTSIEADDETYPRCDFNKPFDFIDLRHLMSTDYLKGEVDWENERHLIWLDYDGVLSHSMLCDLMVIDQNAAQFDICVITIEAKTPQKRTSKKQPDMRRDFQNAFSEFYPIGKKITDKDFPSILQSILLKCLTKGVREIRSDIMGKIELRKLFSFSYADGARMYSLGVIFLNDDNSILGKFDAAEKDHEFISSDINWIDRIIIPNLTIKERMDLDENIDSLRCSGDCCELMSERNINLDRSEIEGYMKYYRFIPQYYEGYL
ncbi:MAG: hypothetical protein E4H14_10595 [Candidatus Thorarchaeota archaeon]|nr:MAG: hypothetical protein E4H14_10595 [Candidatus Thorarchaeota archaeon]